MKRILYITAFAPARVAAGENFSRQLINDLAVEDQVDVIYFSYPYDIQFETDLSNINVIRIFKNNLLIKIINAALIPVLFPLFSVRFNLWRALVIKKIVRNGGYSSVILDFSQTFIYAWFLRHVPVVLIAHDVIAQRYSRVYAGLLAHFCRFSERLILSANPRMIFTFSEKDSELLRKNYNAESRVTNLFLDINIRRADIESVGEYFVMLANWKRYDNSIGLRRLIDEAYPRLRKPWRILIIGSGITNSIRKAASGFPNIEFLGFVDDPYPIIAGAKALLAPLVSGAGVKVKVLESFACGTPVIGFPIAFEGIPEMYSEFMIRSSGFADLADKIEHIEVSISKKQQFREFFLSSYQSGSITRFINREI